MADDVDERLVAGVTEIVFGGTHADGLAALAVQVAPIAAERRARCDTQGIGAAEFFSILAGDPQIDVARLFGNEIVQDDRPVRSADRAGQCGSAARWSETSGRWRGIPPISSRQAQAGMALP